MSSFVNKIMIDPKGYLEHLNSIQESVFNEALEDAVSVKMDPKYNDDLHMIITKNNGDEYYFDSYKYMYPLKANGYIEVINCNVGPGKIVSVGLYGNDEIRVESYDENMMTRAIYKMPQNVTNISAFLLQVGSLHPEILSKLSIVSLVCFMKQDNMIRGYDEENKEIYACEATESFYTDVINAVAKLQNDEYSMKK